MTITESQPVHLATTCPTCLGQGDIIFSIDRHAIVDRPAYGNAYSWPCPTCGKRG